MELSTRKKHLLSYQKQEATELERALTKLEAQYREEMGYYHRLAKMKTYNQAIEGQARLYCEDLGFWERVNAIVARIHLYCWRKAVAAACRKKYQKKRQILEEELFHQSVQHRKERMMVRYRGTWQPGSHFPNVS